MIIFKKAKGIENFLERHKKANTIIGFVPTMGALHSGHISLIEECRKNSGLTVCSIFVNPTQFNDKKDFDNYPITIEKDIQLLYETGCDVLFLPEVSELYHDNEQLEYFKLGFLETILEGEYRPGHFQGVCQVVNKLLNIIHPHQLFMGQKDYQQCMVIHKLLEITSCKTNLNICPTVREESGLAKSSRNVRLNNKAKSNATIIYQSLVFAKDNLSRMPISQIKDRIMQNMLENGFSSIDYIAFCDAGTLNPITDSSPKDNVVVLVAATINNVRLIDNLLLNK